jgi:glucose-6-phosphate isomerase
MKPVAGITLRIDGTAPFLPATEIDALAPRVAAAAADLAARRGPGSEFLGWLDLPLTAAADLPAIDAAAARARADSELYVVIGIGGSYLGARAVLEAARLENGKPEVVFAGQSLGTSALREVRRRLERRDFRLCCISKSGTTLEPALGFRILRGDLVERYGEAEADRRITVVTDARRGALREMATARGWDAFVIPDDVGGRFSVLTPVGLLPLAVAGVDVRALLAGAAAMREVCAATDLRENPAHLYAAVRYALSQRGFFTEVLATFQPELQLLGEWWKQLFGESEGKSGKGVFPASAVYTTDLHSLGQYLQDGRRSLLETFLVAREDAPAITVPAAPGDNDLDGLEYLAGERVDAINWKAYQGTQRAHLAGGVPCLALEMEQVTTAAVGALIYMFENAVAIGGRLLDVNPFDQPGVEAYKKEMFRLLGK